MTDDEMKVTPRTTLDELFSSVDTELSKPETQIEKEQRKKYAETSPYRVPLHINLEDQSATPNGNRFQLHVDMMELTEGRGFRRPRSGKHKMQTKFHCVRRRSNGKKKRIFPSINRATQLGIMLGR